MKTLVVVPHAACICVYRRRIWVVYPDGTKVLVVQNHWHAPIKTAVRHLADEHCVDLIIKIKCLK